MLLPASCLVSTGETEANIKKVIHKASLTKYKKNKCRPMNITVRIAHIHVHISVHICHTEHSMEQF